MKPHRIKTALGLGGCCVALLLARFCPAQERLLEDLLEAQSELAEQSDLYETLEALRRHPLDVNRATLQQLQQIPGLTPGLRRAILEYREKHGRFDSISALRQLEGMTPERFELVRPFLVVATRPARKARVDYRGRLLDRLEKPRGYATGLYHHAPQKVYQRLRFTISPNIEGGLTLEKDSGEQRLDDLRLFYLSLRVHRGLQLLVGNYQLEFGQGLVLWGPYSYRKSVETVFPTRKNGRSASGYTGVDENAAFFGMAATAQAGPVQTVLFGSRAALDATPLRADAVTALATSGLHRTASEKSKKDALTESVFGARIKYILSTKFAVGATFYRSRFDKTVVNPDSVRKRFDFRGRTNWVAGVDWKGSAGYVDFFGEIARSQSGGRAWLLGAHVDLSSVQLALVHRNYERDFQNRHAFGFGERSGPTQNERGFYLGLTYRPVRGTRLRLYYDLFSRPWRTFFEPLPTDGRDFLAQLEHDFGSRLTLAVRLAEKKNLELGPNNDRAFEQRIRRRGRLQVDYRLNKNLDWQSRMEYQRVDFEPVSGLGPNRTETGLLLYQQLKFRGGRGQIVARLTFFDTDSFASRLFQYEPDLPGMVTNRALFGRGSRWFVLVRWRTLPPLEISARYSETFRDDVTSIGSGADGIATNLDRRFGVQLEVRL